MINVAFITSRLRTGGGERQWYELIKGMDPKRFSVTVICLYEFGELGERIAALGIKSHAHLLKNRLSIQAFPRLKDILLKEKVDIVFLWNQPLAMFYGTVAAKMAGIARVVTVMHTTGYLVNKLRYGFVNGLFLRSVRKIVALGTAHKDYIVRTEHISEKKVRIIYNGVEIRDYEVNIDKRKKKEELGIPADAKVVGIVARLNRVKRHDVFLRAAKKIAGQYEKVCFIIVGDGEERDRIEGLISELGLGAKVKMMGLRTDIIEINAILDVAVLSSETEALPMSVIEAMAASVPVVSTRVGSVTDMMTDGENGFLVESGDIDTLAASVLRLLRDEALAAKMGQKGHEVALKKFSRDAMVKEYESLFEEEANT